VDIEFTVQMMQLRGASELPDILVPGTLDAVAALHRTGCLGDNDREFFSESYRFLRGVESSLRLMNTTARHDLPEDDASLTRLAYLLGIDSGSELRKQCQHFTRENRLRFDRMFDEATAAS
jgi:glutamate-ammonia-ligase adenylyltransferase